MAASGQHKPSPTLARFDVSQPPQHPELHASCQSLADVLRPQYWQQLCPQLHVGDAAFVKGAKPLKLPCERIKDLSTQVNDAGVAQVDSQELSWPVDLDVLVDAVVTLVTHGWPPSLLVMYDEVWAMVRQASKLMQAATGGNACNMDILAWFVDPNRGDVGFSPHRDRQPDDSPSTFRPDGSAMYATIWVPLTPATPENSCLYVIPRFADPGYFEGDPEDEGAPDPLTAALSSKESYQNIRALPASPGSALIFTHRTIHWGSKGRPGYPTPRISISWGCADDAFEPAYFGRQHLPCPPLELRLALAGAQMIIYHERFPAPPKQLRLYYEAFTAQAALFDGAYRRKVVREFVDASKEATATAHGASKASADVVAPSEPPANSGEGAKTAAAKASQTSKAKRSKKSGTGSSLPLAGPQQATGPALETGKSDKQQQLGEEQQQAKSSRKRNKTKQAVETETSLAAQVPTTANKQPSKKTKSKHQKQLLAEAARVAAAAASDSDDEAEEDGEGIDWALLAAKAKANKAKSIKGAGGAAAAGSEDEDDVLDMALECMLDGEGDFADDYEDD